METMAKIRRLYHVEEKGFKTIARELGLSKNTIKKVIREDKTVSQYEREAPCYRVLGNYTEVIKKKLEEDRQEPKRRRRTIKKIHSELLEAGYEGSKEVMIRFIILFCDGEGSKSKVYRKPLFRWNLVQGKPFNLIGAKKKLH